MKNSTTSVFTIRPGRSAVVIAVISLLLAATWSARAQQFTLVTGSDALNVYFANNGAVAGAFDPTSDLYNGRCTPVYSAFLNPALPANSELLSPYFFNNSALPLPLGGSYVSGTLTLGTATATINYMDTPFPIGSNTVSQFSATPFSGFINLANTGTGIAELRLDWTAHYTYSGSTPIAPAAETIVDADLSNLGGWAGVAGGLTFYDVSTGSSSSSVIIPAGGDFVSHLPPALHTYAPGAYFSGFATPYSSGTPGLPFGATGSPITPSTGDVIEVVGFLDLVVDPGSIQVTIAPAPPPLVHSARMSGNNLLLDVANGVAGVSYVTCRSTSLAAPLSTWLPVATNIASSTGDFPFTATNVVNPGYSAAFYSVVVPH